jgi:ketosteroid isomerase-like protein
MKTRVLLPAISFSLLLISCSTKPDLESLKSELLQADKDWATAAKKGDIAKLTTYWADDAINFFPGTPPAYGKESILELVQRNRSQSGFSLSWKPEKAVVATSGDMGYTYGTFQLAISDSDSSTVNRSGNYVCIWRKAPETSWKCVVESTIFSSR